MSNATVDRTRRRLLVLLIVGGASLGFDGLALADRSRVYAVLNCELPTTGIGVYAIRLTPDWRSARLLGRAPDQVLHDPTTLAVDARRRLLVVNSQLERAPATPP